MGCKLRVFFVQCTWEHFTANFLTNAFKTIFTFCIRLAFFWCEVGLEIDLVRRAFICAQTENDFQFGAEKRRKLRL